jgi:hypothetical protein
VTCRLAGLIELARGNVLGAVMPTQVSMYSDRQDMYIGQTLCSDGLRMVCVNRAERCRDTNFHAIAMWTNVTNDKEDDPWSPEYPSRSVIRSLRCLRTSGCFLKSCKRRRISLK